MRCRAPGGIQGIERLSFRVDSDDLDAQEAADAHLILICRFLMYLDDTQYKHLKNALDLRNGCGHPTGYQPDPVKLQGYYSDIAARSAESKLCLAEREWVGTIRTFVCQWGNKPIG
jgi:hypothetical protein